MRRNMLLIFVMLAVISTAGVLAGAITINNGASLEFGVGATDLETCASAPKLDLENAFGTGDVLFVSKLTLTEIPTVCDGQKLELRLLDSSGNVLESIFWRLDKIDNTDSSITAIADGTNTSASNSSPASISLNYPDASLNDPDPGLALQAIRVQDVDGFTMANTD